MATMLIALSGGVHTGACMAVPRAIARVRRSARARPAEPAEHEYCLHDEDGNPLGIIRAPSRRPYVGPNAPSVYLRRPA